MIARATWMEEKEHRVRLTDGEIRILVKALNASMLVFGSSMENPHSGRSDPREKAEEAARRILW